MSPFFLIRRVWAGPFFEEDPAVRDFLVTQEHTDCQEGPGAAIPHGGNFDFLDGGRGSTRGVVIRVVDKATHIGPVTWHCPPELHNGVGQVVLENLSTKGFLEKTGGLGFVTICLAPGSSVEVTSDQVHVLFQHNGADGEDKLLSDSTLFGIVVDVKRHNREDFLAAARFANEKMLLKRHLVTPTQIILLSCPVRKPWCRGDRWTRP